MIHCIGDSHTSIFSGHDRIQDTWPLRSNDILPYFRTYRLGSFTAYNLKTKCHIIEFVINQINLGGSDKLLFSFGEIDIRYHLIRVANESNRTIMDVVYECVDRYIDTIISFKKYDTDILIWGPIASFNENKIKEGEIHEGPEFPPWYGNNTERNEVTKIFNDNLKIKCEEYGLTFISIFEDMLTDKYETKEELLDDWWGSYIHLSSMALPIVLKKFTDMNLI